ncbi:chemotaxis protein CheY [Clostridium acetobutylicum]|nr:chemotaxis protein CheY [Clostridium acetobutylicum]
MKVIIVDDDKAMFLIIKKMLSKIPNVEVIGMFDKLSSTMKFLEDNEVDLAFLDIKISGDNGIDLAKQIAKLERQINIVFISSYKEFALDSFDVFPLDYIVKPVSQEKLERAIDRASKVIIKSGEEECKAFIYCFGGLEVRGRNNESVKWISTKSMELFSYLLINGNRSISRYRIIKDIFEEMELKDVESYLNTIVYQLRKALSPLGLKKIITLDSQGYSFDFKNVYVDYIDFVRGVEAIKEINKDNIDRAKQLVYLYKGDLFDDKEYIWAVGEKEYVSNLYSKFLEKVCNWYLENKLINDAYSMGKKLIQYNELDSESNKIFMNILAARRDKISLNKHYERYAKVLFRELGVKVEDSVEELYRKLIKVLR